MCVCMYEYIYVCMYVCMYACMYICVCVYVCVWVCVHEESNILFNDARNTFYLWLYGKGPYKRAK